MGFFSKIKEKLFKKTVTSQIKKKRIENEKIVQEKFDNGLKKSSSLLNESIRNIGKKYVVLNEEIIESIEEALLSFDIGPSSTAKILNSIVEEIKYQNVKDPKLIEEIILDKLFTYYIQNTEVYSELNISKNKLNVILVSGVNGVGKTTSIAKLAYKYKNEGYNVGLIAADTFRAGAVEQLSIWANKIGVEIFKPQKQNQDPASVVFTALTEAKNKKINLIFCDTSGRLENKVNLMNELQKIKNIIKRFEPSQPCESLLVIDAMSGQSGINQAIKFNEVTNLTGIILTKTDSSAKGGIILAIKDSLNIPVKFIGVGEKLDDLQEFDLENFINGLISQLKISN